MTLVNERIVSNLQRRGNVTVINLSTGGAGRRRAWKLIRSLRHLKASLLVAAGFAGTGNLYLALNSGPAVGLDIVMVAAARLRRRQIFFHHHSFRFIDAPSQLLRTLYRIGGVGITDIVLCNRMAEGLRRAYGRSDIRIVPNSIESTNSSQLRQCGGGPIRLGHLANLSLEKGVGRVIEAFEHARGMGFPVELHLAGRIASEDARGVVDRALADWPEVVFFHGFVSGTEKEAFYAFLDLFLYPTDYAVEAQPLVLLEALAAGVPVVTVDRGCIASLMESSREHAVTLCELSGFSASVAQMVRRLSHSDYVEERDSMRLNAVTTAAEFADRANTALNAIVEEILGAANILLADGKLGA